MSSFDLDIEQEKILGKFLSEHYAKNKIEMTRISEKSVQLKGIDIVFEKQDGTEYKFDEKAQLHYLNTALPTFALEIGYLKNTNLKPGWLFDPSKENDGYAFVFSIYLVDQKKKLEHENDIESCEVVFVNKKRLLDELEKLELTERTCRAFSEQLRSNNSSQKISHKLSGFNFQISRHLQEEPADLVS